MRFEIKQRFIDEALRCHSTFIIAFLGIIGIFIFLSLALAIPENVVEHQSTETCLIGTLILFLLFLAYLLYIVIEVIVRCFLHQRRRKKLAINSQTRETSSI
jgi:hypothetical protein